MKNFNVESDAIKYLEEYTGYEMSYERNRKTGEKTSDWYLIEKLIKIDE